GRSDGIGGRRARRRGGRCRCRCRYRCRRRWGRFVLARLLDAPIQLADTAAGAAHLIAGSVARCGAHVVPAWLLAAVVGALDAEGAGTARYNIGPGDILAATLVLEHIVQRRHDDEKVARILGRRSRSASCERRCQRDETEPGTD